MNQSIGAQPGRVTLYGLIRDKHGNPVIDDIHSIHSEIFKLLTDQERAEIEKQRLLTKSPQPYIWS